MNEGKNINMLTFKMIWFALLASQFIYLGVIYMQTVEPSWELAVHMNNQLYLPITFVSLLMVFLQGFIPNLLISSAKKNENFDSAKGLQYFLVPFIIRLALIESIALFGFFLAFMQKNYVVMLPHLSLSICLFFKHFPSESYINEGLKRLSVSKGL